MILFLEANPKSIKLDIILFFQKEGSELEIKKPIENLPANSIFIIN